MLVFLILSGYCNASFIHRGDGKEALGKLLDPSLLGDILENEDRWCDAVNVVLDRCKDTPTEIASVVTPLTIPQQDALMRAVYWGLEKVKNCPVLFKWHAVLVDKAGVGSIVRYLCDRPANKLPGLEGEDGPPTAASPVDGSK
jgi:hypothetical protein